MMWPVSPHAMNGSATPRVAALATPKRDFQAGTVHDNRYCHKYFCLCVHAGFASVTLVFLFVLFFIFDRPEQNHASLYYDLCVD